MNLVEIAQIAGAIGAGVVLIVFLWLVAWPAWDAYGRVWEKIGGLFLSTYVLAAMLAVGAIIGLATFAILGKYV